MVCSNDKLLPDEAKELKDITFWDYEQRSELDNSIQSKGISGLVAGTDAPKQEQPYNNQLYNCDSCGGSGGCGTGCASCGDDGNE